MARYRTYGARDDAPELDGDEPVFGVKLRQHPSQIPRGYCAGAVNLRFREGLPDPRLGTVHLAWLNKTLLIEEVAAILDTSGAGILDTSGAAVLEA